MSGGPGLRRFVVSAPDPLAAPIADARDGSAGPDARATLAAVLGRDLARGSEPSAAGQGQEIEHCELCSAVVPAEHGHLADLETSSLMCACRACYLLFTRPDAALTRPEAALTRPDAALTRPEAPSTRPKTTSTGPGGVRGRYRAIPDRYLTDPEHPMTTSEWDALEIPVGLAFFLRDSRTGEVTGFYPSPAGVTECRLDLQAWAELSSDHPLLDSAEPDVEAILISRPDPRAESSATGAVDCFVVPIDACYELAGRMRLYWRGFDGGSDAKASIADFLDKVRTRARALPQGA